MCLTTIDVENQLAKCMCGLTQGVSLVTFKNDLSLELGEPVAFPEPIIVPELRGNSLFFIALVSMIAFAGLIGLFIAWRTDRKDWQEIANL